MNRRKKVNQKKLISLILTNVLLILLVIFVALLIKKRDGQEKEDIISTDIPVIERETHSDITQIDVQITEELIYPYSNTSYEILYDANADGTTDKIVYSVEQDGIVVNINDWQDKLTFEESFLKGLSYSITKYNLNSYGVKYNNSSGIAIIVNGYLEDSSNLVVVWEYDKNLGSYKKVIDIMYSGQAMPNGFMKNGYVRGIMDGQEIDCVTDVDQNGYILYRSTLLSNLAGMGIYLPKDTYESTVIKHNSRLDILLELIVK